MVCVLSRPVVGCVAPLACGAPQGVGSRLHRVWPCLVARNPSDSAGPDLKAYLWVGLYARQEHPEQHEVPQAAGRVVRDNRLLWDRVRIPASGDIRASLFHGEEQIAAFGATKPIRRLSFGARPTPSARWAVVNSTG